jgi:demethylmenaquinone methyltransferase/2-methoxy-6-polyprenyl-1,4-benzoquinol methylase
MAGYLPDRSGLRLLDLATGTADQILEILDRSDRVETAVGADMAERMLEIGRGKIAARGLTERVELRVGDAVELPFVDRGFDVVTISFGIRNVGDVPRALREMHRVLRPGGRALVLEFSIPEAPVLAPLYLFYLRHILPRLGAIVSGNSDAYRYLNRTIESFPYGRAFARLMEEAGFTEVRCHPQCLGVATIYQGDRRNA